ncbi:MAG: hypothetical protein WCV62_04710 [Candidatus Peribacteraceae bacterium]|jgi:hypothetical protein
MTPRTVRLAAVLAAMFSLSPLAAAESDVHSTVTESVRIEQNGEVHEETRTWTSDDNNAMRPSGAVIEAKMNTELSTRIRCATKQGEDRMECLREVRSVSLPSDEAREVAGFTETGTSTPAMQDWMARCESVLGKGHASCATDGALGSFLQRRMRLGTERMAKIFDRWMKRMERREGKSVGARMELQTAAPCADVWGRGRIRCVREEYRAAAASAEAAAGVPYP